MYYERFAPCWYLQWMREDRKQKISLSYWTTIPEAPFQFQCANVSTTLKQRQNSQTDLLKTNFNIHCMQSLCNTFMDAFTRSLTSFWTPQIFLTVCHTTSLAKSNLSIFQLATQGCLAKGSHTSNNHIFGLVARGPITEAHVVTPT